MYPWKERESIYVEDQRNISLSTSIEDYCLVFVDEDSVLKLSTHGGGQDYFFKVTSFGDEIPYAVAMTDSINVLANDWSFIQCRSDEMCSSPDNLDASSISLVVRFCSCKRRKKGVVDIDNGAIDLI